MATLSNLGSSCYMNSVLQSFAAISQIVETLQTEFEDNTITECLVYILQMLRDKDSEYVIQPKRFYQQVIRRNQEFLQQSDAQEFLISLIDWIHEETKRDNKSNISELFYGKKEIKHICIQCGNVNSVFEDFTIINIDTDQNIYDDLNHKSQLFQSDCCHCKQQTTQFTQSTANQYPNIMVISYKRFKQDSSNIHRDNQPVTIQQEINIEGLNITYKLRAMVHHLGSISGGHYVAQTYRESQWYIYDDEIRQQQQPSQQSQAVYILFYERVNID